jgi:hypothetical protein
VEYIDYALDIRPTSSYNLFIAEVFALDKNVLDLLMSTSIGLPQNVRRKRLINTYSLDIHRLSRILSSDINQNYRSVISYNAFKDNFNQLYVSSFNDDSGNIYEGLTNFYPLNVDNYLKFSGQKYTADFEFSPLISITGDSAQINAEKTIYKASVFPMFPIIFFTNIPAHDSYGPSFLSSINFNMSTIDNVPMVNISCSTVGGKSIEVEKPIERFMPETDTFQPILLNFPESETLFEESTTDFKNLYRASSILDCLIDVNKAHKTVEELQTSLQNRNNKNSLISERIVGFNLQIQNNIEFVYTQPEIDNQILDDNVGPKYAKLSSRTVSGSFTIYSVEPNIITPSYENGITLYFGGPFFYPLPKVNWNNPKVTIKPGGGYLHEISFLAKLPKNTGFFSDNYPVSEIGINFSVLKNL